MIRATAVACGATMYGLCARTGVIGSGWVPMAAGWNCMIRLTGGLFITIIIPMIRPALGTTRYMRLWWTARAGSGWGWMAAGLIFLIRRQANSGITGIPI